ncbi:MAG: peptidoglycan editing factor PgeF [Eubacteriales bacterium]|nr:peptidoglycan editing factor PgeF [Eubacteriales bacterium]
MGMKIKYKNQEHIFDVRERKGVPYLAYPLLERTGIVNHGFSTRLGGVSTGCWASMNLSTSRGDDPEAVAENQRRIAAAIGVDEKKMVFTRQTHTTNVAVVTEKDFGSSLPETDGIITNVPGLCLVTFYADCVPLYFIDPVRKAIGLSHSGWRGTVHKMANVTVEKMQETFGTNPADMIAAIGPSICQDCYEVSEDVIEQFRENYGEEYWDSLYYQKPNGRYQLNLWRANEINFLEAGILKEHMAITNVCTCCNPEVLFSHRVTGTARGNLSAFLALKE